MGKAAIFKGRYVRTLKPNLDLKGRLEILSGGLNPAVSSTNAKIGSLYVSQTGDLFIKEDTGPTPNWQRIGGLNGTQLQSGSAAEPSLRFKAQVNSLPVGMYLQGNAWRFLLDGNNLTLSQIEARFHNNLVVEGDFTVLGTTTTIDTENLSIEDNVILLNKNETGSGITHPSMKAGIEIERGTETNAQLVFQEAGGSTISYGDNWSYTITNAPTIGLMSHYNDYLAVTYGSTTFPSSGNFNISMIDRTTGVNLFDIGVPPQPISNVLGIGVVRENYTGTDTFVFCLSFQSPPVAQIITGYHINSSGIISQQTFDWNTHGKPTAMMSVENALIMAGPNLSLASPVLNSPPSFILSIDDSLTLPGVGDHDPLWMTSSFSSVNKHIVFVTRDYLTGPQDIFAVEYISANLINLSSFVPSTHPDTIIHGVVAGSYAPNIHAVMVLTDDGIMRLLYNDSTQTFLEMGVYGTGNSYLSGAYNNNRFILARGDGNIETFDVSGNSTSWGPTNIQVTAEPNVMSVFNDSSLPDFHYIGVGGTNSVVREVERNIVASPGGHWREIINGEYDLRLATVQDAPVDGSVPIWNGDKFETPALGSVYNIDVQNTLQLGGVVAEEYVTRVSSTRDGVDRLYRSDSDANAGNVQVRYDGSRWFLQGYNGAALSAAPQVRVSYADVAGALDLSGNISAAGTSTSWGIIPTPATNTGSFNGIMGTGSGATWLLSGTSGGTFRGGIQLLDSGGTMRIYTGTGVNYVSIIGRNFSCQTLEANVVDTIQIQLPDGSTTLSEGGGNSVRIGTASGYVDIGPQNSSYCHFHTDRSSFYFGKTIRQDGDILPYSHASLNLGSSTRRWGGFYCAGTAHISKIYLPSATTQLERGDSNSVRLRTGAGYVDIGPQSTTYCHITTDRSQFYFNKKAVFNGDVLPYTSSVDLGSSGSPWRYIRGRVIYGGNSSTTVPSTFYGSGSNSLEVVNYNTDGGNGASGIDIRRPNVTSPNAHHIRFYKQGSYAGAIVSTTTTADVINSSDACLKRDIVKISDESLRKIFDVNIVEYTSIIDPDVRQIGVVAQELEKVYPDKVIETENPYKKILPEKETIKQVKRSYDYELIAAVKYLKRRVDELEEKLELLAR